MRGILIVEGSRSVSPLLAALACSRSMAELRPPETPPPQIETLGDTFDARSTYAITATNDYVPAPTPQTRCDPKTFGTTKRRRR